MTTLLRWLEPVSASFGFSEEASATRRPLVPAGRGNSAFTDHNVERWLGIFLLVGLAARAIRYGLCFPLWDDESFLCANFIDRGYRELMQPLDYHQVAPLLFLWIEHTATKLFGYSENVLRLFPFVCSIASLVLFRRVAGRLLRGRALLIAVGIFAVSYPGIRYAAEAKPYGSDLFVSLLLASLVVEWLTTRGPGFLWMLAALTPIVIGLSYPAVFAAGGMSLVVGCVMLQEKRRANLWAAWAAWNVALLGGFLFWFHLGARVQGAAEGEFMGAYWKSSFPPVWPPWQLPYWMLKTHASDFLAYPLGGPNWASTLTLLLCLSGLWVLARERRGLFLGVALAPVALHFLAAALHRYPYGGHVKFSQYIAPMICCVAAVGGSQWIAFCVRRRPRWSGRELVVPVAVLLLIGLGTIGRDFACPYKTASDFRERAFAQSFWFRIGRHDEVLCLKADSGSDFCPDQYRDLSWSAQYLCNRAIEARRWHLRPANLGRVTTERPLRCVLYRDDRFAFDQKECDRWLAEMQSRFQLIGHETVSLPRYKKDDRKLIATESVDSYTFIPRPVRVAATTNDRAAASAH